MESVETRPVSLPAEICGCRIDRILSENSTYLAAGPGGRPVVLKVADPDCLLRGSLHPSVRDRLSRVRELAHPNVANLFGVEREGDVAYSMWEYVEGHPFDLYVSANRTPREVATLARELALAVDLLHLQGIVHGALIGNNVIISPCGTLRLTHISPLLYTDCSVDIECLWDLLDDAAAALGERGLPLAAVVRESRENKTSLRQLAGRLSTLVDNREGRKAPGQNADPGFGRGAGHTSGRRWWRNRASPAPAVGRGGRSKAAG